MYSLHNLHKISLKHYESGNILLKSSQNNTNQCLDTNRNAFGNFKTAHSITIPHESGGSSVRSVELVVGLSGSGSEGRAIVEASQAEQSDEADEDVGEELRSRADSLAPGVLHAMLKRVRIRI